jgi:hypothetical protein
MGRKLFWSSAFRHWQVRNDKQVQDVFTVHEHYLRPFTRIQFAPKPVARRLRYLATCEEAFSEELLSALKSLKAGSPLSRG